MEKVKADFEFSGLLDGDGDISSDQQQHKDSSAMSPENEKVFRREKPIHQGERHGEKEDSKRQDAPVFVKKGTYICNI